MDSTTNTEDSQDNEYTNLDLETAEQLLIAAGEPKLAEALTYQTHGIRNLVQGEWGKAFAKTLEDIIRKEIGGLKARQDASYTIQEQRFDYVLLQLQAHLDKENQRHAVIDASDKTTLDALTSVAHRLDEITSYVQQSVTIAREALTVAKAGAARLGKFKKDLDGLRAGQSRISNEIKEVDARHGGQWEQAMLLITESQADRRAIHQELAAVKADIAALAASSERGDVDALKAQLAELRGDYSPEERARLTGVLLRMIAEYEATHGDG